MRSNTPRQENAAIEQLATVIALKIINWQSWLATGLNNWLNHFTKRQQRWLLMVCCAVFATGLILVVPNSNITLYSASNNYQPTHIGLPSERPGPAQKITDSLTINK